MNDFQEQLVQRTAQVNGVILSFLPKEEGFQKTVIEAMNYSVVAGGKRIRPMIMQETFRMFGGKTAIVGPFMAALECIHTYSLVHDDLPAMDNDDYRRGRLTTHKKFGEDMGILAGDGLLNFAYEIMANAVAAPEQYQCTDVVSAAKAMKEIADKAGIYGMVGGQTLDVELTDRPMRADQLDFIFRLKTGALLEAAFVTGGLLAGVKEETAERLAEIGCKVGLAFQIQDDILDLTSTTEELGKPVGSDEKNHKTTYVSLYGMEAAKQAVEQYSKEALEELKQLGQNEFLEQLIMELIHRKK